jgi:hypothetical protein
MLYSGLPWKPLVRQHDRCDLVNRSSALALPSRQNRNTPLSLSLAFSQMRFYRTRPPTPSPSTSPIGQARLVPFSLSEGFYSSHGIPVKLLLEPSLSSPADARKSYRDLMCDALLELARVPHTHQASFQLSKVKHLQRATSCL